MFVFCCVLPVSNKPRDDDDEFDDARINYIKQQVA